MKEKRKGIRKERKNDVAEKGRKNGHDSFGKRYF
jgi:hypothetical protein